MLKRILVVLDGSDTAKAAKAVALKLAKKMNAQVTGLGIIDTPWITAAQPEPLGGGAYKIHRDKAMIKKTRARIQKMLKNFAECGEKLGVDCQVREVEGFPAMEIGTLSQEHDLIIIGKKADFRFDLDDDTDLTVKHITHDNPRPLMIVNEDEPTGETVLIAYDGSVQAARSLHMYLLLGIGQGLKTHILSISRRQEEADRIAKRAEIMCSFHGLKAKAEGVSTFRAPEKVIMEKADAYNASMIVMGAYGEQSLKEIFFGSCTEHVMKKSKIPLFIHH